MVKRVEVSPLRAAVQRGLSVVIAIGAAAAIIALLGYNPFQVYSEMAAGALGSAYRLQQTVTTAVPLIVMGLGFSICYKMKFTNIGVEGQFYMGALGATAVVIYGQGLPGFLLLPAMALAAALLGGLWCLVPAVLKVKWQVSETLVTLMMNYIAIKLVSYLQYGPWKDPQAYGFPKIMDFPPAAQLPKLLGVHAGWLAALVLAGLVYLLINRSKFGYEVTVLGENPLTARYAGIATTRVLIVAVMLAGGLCGLAGLMQAAGVEKTMNDQLSGGMGFTSIVAAFMAQLNPLVLLFVSFFFAVVLQGGAYIQSSLQIPAAAAEIVQGTILLFVLSCEFFNTYRLVLRTKKEEGCA